MKRTLLILFIQVGLAQSPQPVTPAVIPPVSSMVVGFGGGYNHYSSPASYEAFVNIAVQIGTSNFWSISTVSFQTKTAGVRSGFGYAVKSSGPVLLLLLADGGAIVSSTTANPAISTSSPAASAFALGNVGGGAYLRYDLGDLTPILKNIGIGAGFRMAAITSVSVQPEILFSISYFLK